jgi:hypothetical protein
MTTQTIAAPTPSKYGALILRLNAAFSAICAILLLLGGDSLSQTLGIIPTWVVPPTAVFLLVYASGLAYFSTRTLTALQWRVAALLDDIWIVTTLLLVVANVFPLTSTGVVAILVTNIVLASFAVAEWLQARTA